MPRQILTPDGHAEFSLVQGGPLFQLLLRTGLVKPSMDLLTRRIIVISLVTWLPLLVLSLVSGRAFGGPGVPFLLDIGAHVRLLICVPLLIGAEVLVHRRIRITVRQFLDRGIVAPEDRARFENLIDSAMRVRNSVVAELLVLALAIGAAFSLGQRYITMQGETWYVAQNGATAQLTPAGYWYLFFSLTILRFLMLRWYFRLFIWYRFLWQVSRRIPLRLDALHPDRSGGLGFLTGSVFAYQPILLAHTIALAGIVGGKIWHEGATLPQFKVEIAAWLLFLMLLVLAPLFFFVIHLADAKRAGLREYGLLASRYVADFRRKWMETRAGADEALLGTADIQSLSDLANSFDVVRQTGVVPFDRTTVLRLAVLTALPLTPLTLTMIPLDQLIDRALGVFL